MQFNALIDRLQGTLRRVIETVEVFAAHADETGKTAHELVANVDRKSLAARSPPCRGSVHEDRRTTAAIVVSTREQELSARRIEQQAKEVVALVQGSGAAVRESRGQTDLLAAAIETLQAMDVRDRDSFGRSELNAERLTEKAQVLLREIEHLKPREARMQVAARLYPGDPALPLPLHSRGHCSEESRAQSVAE